jgi:hypothetical protein
MPPASPTFVPLQSSLFKEVAHFFVLPYIGFHGIKPIAF